MAMSDCIKCWDTPCTCGYEYETWETSEVQKLADVLTRLLARRAAGEARRQNDFEIHRDGNKRIVKTTATDWGGSITIEIDDSLPADSAVLLGRPHFADTKEWVEFLAMSIEEKADFLAKQKRVAVVKNLKP